MNIIFLDIDGVLVNRASLMKASGIHARADLRCVTALNHLIQESNASIVISSTWRYYIPNMQPKLNEWGVHGTVVGYTPRLNLHPRGNEIQSYLDKCEHPVSSFVILDDDNDMGELIPFLVQSRFEIGLTMQHARRALSILRYQQSLPKESASNPHPPIL